MSQLLLASTAEFRTLIHPFSNQSQLSRVIEIEIEFTDWSKTGPLSIVFPHRYGPATYVYRQIADLEVINNGQVMPTAFREPIRETQYADWSTIESVNRGSLLIRYKFLPQDYNYQAINAVWPVIHQDRAVIKGASVFAGLALSNGQDFDWNSLTQLEFKFNNEDSTWETHCASIQVSAHSCQFAPGTDLNRALYDSAFAVGNWDTKIEEIGQLNVKLLRAGQWSFGFNEYIEYLSTPINWMVEKMGGHNIENIQIISDTIPSDIVIPAGRETYGGERLIDSTYQIYMPNMSEIKFRRGGLHLPLHEFHHSYNWAWSNNQDRMNWFHEGLTDYMAYASVLRSTALEREDHLDYINDLALNYFNQWAHEELSIEEASEIRWENSSHPWQQWQIDDITYRQTVMLSLILDWKAKQFYSQQSDAPQMTDVLNELWRVYGMNKISFNEDEFYNTLEQVMGSELKDYFRQHIKNTDELPVAEFLEDLYPELSLIPQNSTGLKFYESQNQLFFSLYQRGLNKTQSQAIGLVPGDRITSLGNELVNSIDDFNHSLRVYRPGDEVVIGYIHQGQSRVTRAKVKNLMISNW